MGKNTSFVLDEHYSAFIDGEIAAGRYRSASEVIRSALRLLEETRTVKTARLQVTLRCAVDLINSSSDQCFARIEHVASDQADPRPGVWHSSGMNRIRLSTTVDAALLTSARDMRAGITDAALIDEALAALLARHRSAEVDASYAAYDKHPVDEPDEWGDLASWRRAAGDS